MDFRENSRTGDRIFVGYEVIFSFFNEKVEKIIKMFKFLQKKNLRVLNFDKQQGKFKLEYEFLAHLDPIKNITLNAPKGIMVTGCRDGSARIWETEKHQDKFGNFRNKTIANLDGHV